MWNPFAWVVNLFRRERAKLRSLLAPFALKVAEDLFERDFNGDGVVADARIEFGKLLRGLNYDIRAVFFAEFFNRDKSIRSDVIELLPLPLLKKALAIAKMIELLVANGWPVSRVAILKHGWGILDSALQDAYEKRIKPKKTS